MKQIRVMVFPCGSEVGLEICNSLKDISFIELYGASSTADHGKFVFENYIEGIPYITAPDFLEKMNQVLDEHHIDYLYPAMDQVVDVLSEHRDALHAQLIAPCHDSVHVCRSKQRTYQRLDGLDFMPKTYQDPREVKEYPVIIKPSEGYGAKGFRILHTQDELLRALEESGQENVICEYLEGEEYTIDCFTDRHGVLQYASCRNRNRIRNGISVNSSIQPLDEKIETIAKEIMGRIPMRGAWFFQLKRNGLGQYKLMEVATRIAGTMCVQRARGVNMPLLSLFDWMGYDVEITPQFEEVEVDRALYNVFRVGKVFRHVYLDYDDTLVVHGRVNCNLMRYLYQCLNQGIPLTVVSKHDGDLIADMKAYHISPDLFQEIIHIGRDQRKCDVICPEEGSLLIDDSFAERKEMAQAHGMTTIGVDGVDALIDYRI